MSLNFLPNEILEKATYLEPILGIDEYAWQQVDALEVIRYAINNEVGILGGDVYKSYKGEVIPTYDNWYCSKLSTESQNSFAKRSGIVAEEYVKGLPEHPDVKLILVLVFDRA